MLDIQNLSKTYRTKHGSVMPVQDMSVQVQAGEFVAVYGPSGCGKSTLLLMAGGLLKPDQGTVTIDGKNIYDMSAEERARFRAKHIGFVFQQFHLIPYLNVLDNVLSADLAVSVPDAGKRATEILTGFGLAHRLEHLPGQLSTGERQRTALARALLHKPGLLLADEPTGNLDEDNGRIVLTQLAEYARAGGAVLLVTHDVRAAEFAGRTISLEPTAQYPVESITACTPDAKNKIQAP